MPQPDAVLDLPALPSMGAQMLRSVVVPKAARSESLTPVALRVRGVHADPARLQRYREVCGFDADGFLPVTYPQVMATSLLVSLLARPDFPHRLLGIIHVRNHIRQQRRLAEGARLDLTCWAEGRRSVHAGEELDVAIRADAEGAPVWQAAVTMLKRGAAPNPNVPKPQRAGDAEEAERFAASRPATWDVPENTGRRYAGASGDFNPIHLTALTARPFGFRRPIAHGMWTLARCVAELGEAAHADALVLDCEFRRPVLLPTRVTFHTARGGEDVDFRVASEEGKTHLLGRLAGRFPATGSP
jgi:acyl dehydratase